MDPIPKLKSLVHSLKELDLGDYLTSRNFIRYSISSGFEETWRQAIFYVETDRRYFDPEIDHHKYDSVDALVLLLNDFYGGSRGKFYVFVRDLLQEYSKWSNADIDMKEIIEDLELLSFPKSIVEEITTLNKDISLPVPGTVIPNYIGNYQRLEECITKMEASIKSNDYNLTLTYAYSSLEGLFKAYVATNLPGMASETDLPKLSKLVKNHLKAEFQKSGMEYPEPMLNLISTITSAVSNARNGFSDSHFDRNAEKWLAEFAKDCVNAIGRLVVIFIVSESKPGS